MQQRFVSRSIVLKPEEIVKYREGTLLNVKFNSIKMVRRIHFLRTFILSISFAGPFVIGVYGQDPGQNGIASPINTEVTPVSPSAASLGAFGNTDVNLFTGKPNINIPLYELSLGNFKLPINLSYSNDGLKVAETPSLVGLGWTLNATGVISREVRGLPDESLYGWNGINNLAQQLDDYKSPDVQLSDDERWDYEYNITEGNWDSQPDVFYFNVGQHSGKIVFDKDKKAHIIPFQKLIVEVERSQSNIDKWTITDNNGVTYEFVETETTWYENTTSGIVFDPYVSSWYLSKITLENGVDEIIFQYSSPILLDTPLRSVNETLNIPYPSTERDLQTIIGDECPIEVLIKKTFGLSEIESRELRSIQHPFGRIAFNRGEGRADLIGAYTLGDIQIYNNNNSLIKSYDFDYDYSGTGSALNKRLYLNSITESSANDKKPPYLFYYNAGGGSRDVTSMDYYKQDHWGYYNSNPSNSTMIPTITIKEGTSNRIIENANRSPDPDKAKTGMLYKIRYPTGGTTEFEYEPHTYDYMLNEGGDSELSCDIDTYNEHIEIVNVDEGDGEYFVNGSFEITTKQCVSIDYYLKAVDLDFEGEGQSLIKIGNEGGTWQKFLLSTSDPSNVLAGTEKIELEIGTYLIETQIEEHTGVVCEARITVNYNDYSGANSQAVPVIAGGLRLKKQTDCPEDGGNCTSKNYSYILEDDNIYAAEASRPHVEGFSYTSSGMLINTPVYAFDYTLFHRWYPDGSQASTTSGFRDCVYKTLSSSSNMVLSRTQGSHIGYSKVTVYEGESGENGKVVNIYTNVDTYPDGGLVGFPFPPRMDFGNRRGLLLEQTFYKTKGDEFVPIKRIKNEYEINNALNAPNKSYVVGIKPGYKKNDPKVLGYANGSTVMKLEPYLTYSEWNYMKKSTISQIDDNGNEISSDTEYHYDNPHHIQLTRLVKENSQGEITTQINKYPQDFTDHDSGILSSLVQKNKLGSLVESQIWKGDVNNQKLIGASVIEYAQFYSAVLPKRTYALEINNPVDDYVNRVVSNDLLNDTRFTKNAEYSFDNRSNLLSYEDKSGLPITYEWTTIQPTPIARVINNLRTSYTYDYAFRLTSQTDPNGQTTYYEYDDLGRLIRVRDQEQKIIKTLSYYYRESN